MRSLLYDILVILDRCLSTATVRGTDTFVCTVIRDGGALLVEYLYSVPDTRVYQALRDRHTWYTVHYIILRMLQVGS